MTRVPKPESKSKVVPFRVRPKGWKPPDTGTVIHVAPRPKIKLRDYQLDDLREIERRIEVGSDAVLYVAPTGSGKTEVLSEMVRRAVQDGQRILILCHRIEIIEQTIDALRRVGGISFGVISPGYDGNNAGVQIASVFTLSRRLKRLKKFSPDLCLIDEGHHVAAATWGRIIAELPRHTTITGFTATPRRLDGKPLGDVFDEMVISWGIKKLIKAGYLSPCVVYVPAKSPDLSAVRTRAGDYANEELAEVMGRGIIVQTGIDEYERLCSGVPAIAFCVNIEHSKMVAAAFQQRGYRAAHIDGNTPRDERRRLIRALASGELDVLSNCGLISEGLNVPGVVAAILLRPTKSLALYLQMVGRALRPAPGKEMAYILDHAGNTMKHGLPTASRRWSLHSKKQPESGEASDLMRCPSCGAVNPRSAETCEQCGAELHERRPELVEVAGRQLAEMVDEDSDQPSTNHADGTPSMAQIAAWPYRYALLWAGNNRSRLQLIADAKGYKSGWVYYALRGEA